MPTIANIKLKNPTFTGINNQSVNFDINFTNDDLDKEFLIKILYQLTESHSEKPYWQVLEEKSIVATVPVQHMEIPSNISKKTQFHADLIIKVEAFIKVIVATSEKIILQ